MSDSNIEIDESQLKPAPGILQKLRNAVTAIVFGAVLVQVFLFYGATRSGSFTPASILIYFDSYFFWVYLGFCGVLGWISGQDFLQWLLVKINFWKFW